MPPVHRRLHINLDTTLEELYRLNAELSPEDEQELDSLPDLKDIPGPERFREWITLEEKLSLLTPKVGSPSLWSQDAGVQPTPEELEALAEQARQTGRSLLEAEAWELALIGEEKEIAQQYESLFERAELLFKKATSEAPILLRYRPELARDIPLEEQAELAQQLVDLARNRGGRLRGWDVLFSPRRRRFIQAVRVAGKPPSTASHFRALASKARLLLDRENLSHLWDYLVVRKGGPHSKDFGEEPERAIKGYAHRLRGWLSLRREKLVPLIRRLEDLGFLWRKARETVGASSPHTSPEEHWRRLGEYLAHHLSDILRARALEGRVRALEEEFSALLKRLDSSKATPISVELKSAILQKDPQA